MRVDAGPLLPVAPVPLCAGFTQIITGSCCAGDSKEAWVSERIGVGHSM